MAAIQALLDRMTQAGGGAQNTAAIQQLLGGLVGGGGDGPTPIQQAENLLRIARDNIDAIQTNAERQAAEAQTEEAGVGT